jgi:hypothetical protein
VTTEVLNLNELAALATLLDAAKRNARVEWLVGNNAVADGVARHFVLDPENAAFLGDGDDVRDAYFRVSGNVEHFFPVTELLAKVRLGEFVVAS